MKRGREERWREKKRGGGEIERDGRGGGGGGSNYKTANQPEQFSNRARKRIKYGQKSCQI